MIGGETVKMTFSTGSDSVISYVRRYCAQTTRQRLFAPVFLATSLGALLFGMIPPTTAGVEILSDMDCVVEPSSLIEIGSAVPGLLAESRFDRGDFVEEGTLLARLESNVERVTLSIAETVAGSSTSVDLRKLSAQFGERTRNRNEKLIKTSVVSQQAMDQVNTEAKIAQLQVLQEQENQRLALLEVARAKAVLGRREIRSPISGSVVQRYKAAGEYVDSDAVYQIAQLDPLNVEVIVPIEYLGTLEVGMDAQIAVAVPGFEGKTLNGIVRRIDAVADAASATYGVRLSLDNSDFMIPSGVRCLVDFYAS